MRHPDSIPHTAPRGWKAWRLHVLLFAILAGEWLVAFALHRPDAELRRMLESGSPRDRVYTLFVLTNRDTPEAPDRDAVKQLLATHDPLVCEWTMTTNFARFGPPIAQEAYAAARSGTPTGFRCQFLLNYRAVAGPSMTLADLRRFLDAAGADP